MPPPIGKGLYIVMKAIFRNHNKIALLGMANVIAHHLTPEELTSMIGLFKSVDNRKRSKEESPNEQED